MILVVVPLLVGCDVTLSEIDNIYSRGADHPVLCGISIDNKNTVSADAIAVGLDRATVDETILHLYSHKPNGTIDESTLEQVVAGAADRNMTFVTYADLADGTATQGLALSFDDHDIVGWNGLLPMFDLYGARVTFFISHYTTISGDDRELIRNLAAAGHAIEYHSTAHRSAETYSAEHGIEAYIADDILPGLAAMRADGYSPRVFAYPFGARTGDTDVAVLEHFPLVRASHFNCPR
ncbi:MAG: polysaccharide deacetylase family protein [Deltaproteobacteria bacterium]|nr:polysaccharide deacetylase family protein [Deltaproteobacteria bacterium]